MTPHGEEMRANLKALVEVDSNGCWIWQATISPRGYGSKQDPIRGYVTGAHRVSYEAFVGPIPADMTVDHLCFVPTCINPEHLRLLTREENSRNQRSRSKDLCVNGHQRTPDNLYVMPSGSRDCRACIRDRVRRYKCKAGAVVTDNATANDHTTPGIPRDLPMGAFGGAGPVMWGDE